MPALRLFEAIAEDGLRSAGGLFRWGTAEDGPVDEESEPVVAMKVDGDASAFLATTGPGQVINLALYDDAAHPDVLSGALQSALATAIRFGAKRGAKEMILRARGEALVAFVIDPSGERLAAAWYRTALDQVTPIELVEVDAWPVSPARRHEPRISDLLFDVLARDENRPTYAAFGENVAFLCERKDDGPPIFHLGEYSDATAEASSLLRVETIGAPGSCAENLSTGETAERALSLARRVGFGSAHRVDISERADASKRSWRYLAREEGGQTGWTLYDLDPDAEGNRKVCTGFPLRHEAAQGAAEWLARLDGERCEVAAGDRKGSRVLIVTISNKGAIIGSGRREPRNLQRLPVGRPDGPPDRGAADKLLTWLDERYGESDGCEAPVRWARSADGGLFLEDGCRGVAGGAVGDEPLVDLICYRRSGSVSEVGSPRLGPPTEPGTGRPQARGECPLDSHGNQLIGLDDALATSLLDRLDGALVEWSQDEIRHAWAVDAGSPGNPPLGLAIREPGASSDGAGMVSLDLIAKEGCVATHALFAKNGGTGGHAPSAEALAALSRLLSASDELPLYGEEAHDVYLAAAPASDGAVTTPALAFFLPPSPQSEDRCKAVLTAPMGPLGERSKSEKREQIERYVALIGRGDSSAWRKFNDKPLRTLTCDDKPLSPPSLEWN